MDKKPRGRPSTNFDKTAYQREYMRQRRLEDKEHDDIVEQLRKNGCSRPEAIQEADIMMAERKIKRSAKERVDGDGNT